MNINLTQQEQNIFAIISKVAIANDVTPRVAGGWVRDKLLGKDSNDIDISLDTMTGLQFAKLLAKETGETIATIEANPEQSKHLETARTKVNGVEIDLVNLRSETYTDTRIPQVTIGTPLQDAERRDLTINSLFFNILTNEVEDFTNKGMKDLNDKVIRTPFEGTQTFIDDPLRLLRVIRFAVRFNFNIAPETLKAMKDKSVIKALKDKIAAERIATEINKSFKHDCVKTCRLLFETDIVSMVLPELKTLDFDQQTKYHHLTTLEHTYKVVEKIQATKDLNLIWAALLHDLGKAVKQQKKKGSIYMNYIGHERESGKIALTILERMRFSKENIKEIVTLVSNHMFMPPKSNLKLKRKLREVFDNTEVLNKLLKLRLADIEALNPTVIQPIKENHLNFVERVESLEVDKLLNMKALVDGNELQDMFQAKPGQWIKHVKNIVIDRQLTYPETTKEQILDFLKTRKLVNGKLVKK